ncbi:hypothetical protein [Hymenobacter actinosclerus]|uniref:Outer membrane protein beta-barrel domain-containing protein n=1 Tax=Hymenobacter actinosclerus TaxID=82805 RepID=A0A1I0J1U4_9BACT|nr:hypothetical protein [Hymenobacter actinosclerus]SEU03020.1 hypothetical protein SAMN04487998_3569 [Hymenobacter actinosclerus]
MQLKKILAGLLLAGSGPTLAQQADAPMRRVGVQVHYGAVGNFFASSFRDTPYELQHVRLLGTAGGAEVSYRVGQRGTVALGYTRSVNMDEKHIPYQSTVGTRFTDFRLRYVNNAFQALYERELTPYFKAHAGLLYLTTASQTIYPGPLSPFGSPTATIYESNRGNSYAEEGGVVAGLEYSRPIDTRLRLGLKVRGYYLISVSTFEMLTLTPTLTYQL